MDGFVRRGPAPPARHDGLGAVAPGVNELAIPPAGAQQAGKNLFQRLGKVRLQEFAGNSAGSFFARPTVLLLGASIPVSDDVVHVANEDRIVGEVEKCALRAQRLDGGLVALGERVVPPIAERLMKARARGASTKPVPWEMK